MRSVKIKCLENNRIYVVLPKMVVAMVVIAIDVAMGDIPLCSKILLLNEIPHCVRSR